MASADAWEDAGLVEVLLPSGRRVRGKLPDLVDLARRGQIPTDLLAWIMKTADPKWLADPTPDPDVDDTKVQGYLDELVVLFVRQVEVDGEWVDHRIDQGRLDNLLDGERFTLELVASYRLTPEAASLRSALIEVGVDPDTTEVDDGVSRLGTFRDGADGPAARDDGEGMGDPTVDADRPARRRRIPGRRSDRDAAGDRDAANARDAGEVADAPTR